MAGHISIFEEVLPTLSVNPQQLGASATANGTGVNMTGFDAVAFMLAVGGGDKTVDMKVQDSADDVTYADITGYTITQITTGQTNRYAIISIYRPTKKFLRPVVTTGAGGTVSRDVGVMAYRTRYVGQSPVTLPAASELVKKQQN